MKCPNCGEENQEGMKFCGNCGTKLPEPMNHCPSCNKDWSITMKFCGECGFKFGGGSAAGAGSGAGAISMGDKNVIAGDVVSNVSNVDNSSTVNNTTNTTTVINSDETKKVKKCRCCGKLIPITEGYYCPECGEFTCSSCYDSEKKLCKSCIDKKEAAKTAQSNQFMEFLTTTEELELKKAVELFYEEGKYLEAYNLAFPIWEKHKTDETVQNTFWQIAVKFLQKAGDLVQDFGDDVPFYIGVACTLFFIRANEFDMAERLIKTAKQLEDEEDKYCMNIRYNDFLLNLALFKKYNDKSFLERANAIIENEIDIDQKFTEFDKLENSWKIVLLNELSKCKGEEPMEFDKEFCKENKLYYDFVNSDVFAFAEE